MYIFLNKQLDYQGQVRAKVEVAVANLHSVSYVNSSSCICFKSVNNSCLYLYICTQPSVPSPKLVSSPRQIVSNLKRMSLFLRKFFDFEKVGYCQDWGWISKLLNSLTYLRAEVFATGLLINVHLKSIKDLRILATNPYKSYCFFNSVNVCFQAEITFRTT